MFLNILAIMLFTYLLGAIPTGYWVGKVKGIDIREHGSKNIGFTNTFRVLGKTAGIIVFIIDFSKGYLAVVIAQILCSNLFDLKNAPASNMIEWIKTFAGLSAICGHNWTVFLGFKGGKGVLTSAGVFFALMHWTVTSLTVILFLATLMMTHYISAGSLVAAVSLPLLSWLLSEPIPFVLLSLVASIFIIYKHIPNISRLRAGTENRWSFSKKGTLQQPPRKSQK